MVKFFIKRNHSGHLKTFVNQNSNSYTTQLFSGFLLRGNVKCKGKEGNRENRKKKEEERKKKIYEDKTACSAGCAQTLPDATPPICKNHQSSKFALTFYPMAI